MENIERNKFDNAVTSSPFVYDEKYKTMMAEINGVRFECDKLNFELEERAYRLEACYRSKFPWIVSEIIDEIILFFGDMSEKNLMNSLGIPTINLDNGLMTYTEHELDDVHIINIEFEGLFDEILEVSIDG